ncbi:MAG: hypothetical protein HYX69_11350 [Planctomycetia bacterium]|nr:hypothetical protein [Planctomycetia bacterium]
MPDGCEEACRETYAAAGHLFYPTFEQWELDFLRDAHPASEILEWQIIANSLRIYRERYNSRGHAKDKDFALTLATISWGGDHGAARERGQKRCGSKKVFEGLLKVYDEHRAEVRQHFLAETGTDIGTRRPPVPGPRYPAPYPIDLRDDDLRALAASAPVWIGHDTYRGAKVIFYGRAAMEALQALPDDTDETLEGFYFCYDQRTDSLEYWCAACKVLKGGCDYEASDPPGERN